MGEVLENGVYLPDEGERNAYNGLKGNWNTVDTVVAQVQALSSTGLIRKPVDELPTEDIETNVIYMLKAEKPNGDIYRIEYMYIDNHWDALGTSETTLDDYYTKAETDDLPAVKSGVNATKVSNYDTHIADTDIHVTLANKQTWDGKQNALDTAQTAAVNSGVTGTKVTGYDNHVADTNVHVTASDKTAWNGKQDGLSQTQLAAVNSGITSAKVTGYDSHIADTDVHVTTADKAAWNGKQDALTQTQLDNIATIPDKANSADLATVATSGSYTDLINAPTIPTVNNATLTIQKNGTDVATFTANASSNVTANLAIPVNTSDLNNDAGFLTQHNPIDDALSATSENALQNKVVKSELDGKAPLVHTHAASDVTSGTFNIARIPNLDASKITSGTIDIARLPKGALERLVKVANQAARYALTTDDVQLGDTVQQLDTGVMYVVTDETKLDSADGYTEFTAGSASSVPWTGVTGKPNDYPPSSHTHTKSQITDFPALATVATSGSYNDLNNIPASFTPSSHTHGNLTNDGKVGTTANKPLITGTDGVVQAGSFGNAANTFCEGNDSRLSDARTPLSHTHTKSDVTDLFNSANSWTEDNTYAKYILMKNTTVEVGNAPSNNTSKEISFTDKNNKTLSRLVGKAEASGNSYIFLHATNKYTNNALDPNGSARHSYFYVGLDATGKAYNKHAADTFPDANNTYNLGSSSYQWNNLYAKNYYYNGVAWGLDKANVWSGDNSFTSSQLTLKNSNITRGTIPNANRNYVLSFADSNNDNVGMIFQQVRAGTGSYKMTFSLNNGTTDHRFNFLGFTNGTSSLIPEVSGVTELGSSDNKWKTLNGVNPGALSLPDCQVTQSIDRTGWVYDGATYNTVVLATTDSNMTKNGWLYVRMANTTSSDKLSIKYNSTVDRYPTNTFGDTGGSIEAFVPVVANTNLYLLATKDLSFCKFYPCLGNVPSGV